MVFKSRVKRKVLGGQGREIVSSVLKFMNEEGNAARPIIDIKNVSKLLIFKG